MNNLLNNLPHLIIATIVVGAVAALMAVGVVDANAGLPIIIGVAGVSLGGAVGSTSVSSVAAALPAVSSSTGNQTTTITPSSHTAQPTHPEIITTSAAS